MFHYGRCHDQLDAVMKLKGPPNNVLITICVVERVFSIIYFYYEGTKTFVLSRQYFVKTVFFITDLARGLLRGIRMHHSGGQPPAGLLATWGLVG
jgi:hypothetical protein